MSTLASFALTANHLKGIGLVAAEWSYCELALESIIWQVAGIDSERGYAITTHIGSETRIHIVGALAEKKVVTATLKTELKAIVAELRRLRTERNNIVHSVWLSGGGHPKFFTLASHMRRGRRPNPDSVKITAKGKVIIHRKPIPSKQIHAIAKEIGDLLSRMHKFQGELSKQDPIREGREKVAAALLANRLARGQNPTTKGPLSP
jgi:hypothetical protein